MTEQTNRVQDVLNQTGLNWTVREESLTTESGIIIPQQKAIIRDDTNTVLSVHGEGYYPYQNHQLIELLDKVSQQVGLPIHKGGMFGDGKKVFIQLKSNDLKLGTDRERVSLLVLIHSMVQHHWHSDPVTLLSLVKTHSSQRSVTWTLKFVTPRT